MCRNILVSLLFDRGTEKHITNKTKMVRKHCKIKVSTANTINIMQYLERFHNVLALQCYYKHLSVPMRKKVPKGQTFLAPLASAQDGTRCVRVFITNCQTNSGFYEK